MFSFLVTDAKPCRALQTEQSRLEERMKNRENERERGVLFDL